MGSDKQIEEIAKVIKSSLDGLGSGNFNFTGGEISTMFAEALYNAGYRKIYDDHQRQCTCYALGCQMAEGLKKKVAREIIDILKSAGVDEWRYPVIAELKKKYTEREKDNG
jgi:hypothetical protein